MPPVRLYKEIMQIDFLYHFLSFVCGIVAMIVYAYLKPTNEGRFVLNRLEQLNEKCTEIRVLVSVLERRKPPRGRIEDRRDE